MGEINLLNQRDKTIYRSRLPHAGNKIPLWILIGLVAVEMIVYGTLFSWKKSIDSEILKVQASVNQLDDKLNSSKVDINNAVAAQAALTSFSSLLDNHLHWTLLWSELGKVTLKKAHYISMQGTVVSDQFVVKGEVSNYTDLGKVILGLETSKNFSEVKLVSSSPAEGDKVGVQFEIQVTVKHSIFLEAQEKK